MARRRLPERTEAMNITQARDGATLRVALEGRLDTLTSRELEAALRNSLDGVTLLELDFAGLEYVSSAGLRVLLAARKAMSRQGEMRVTHVPPDVMEVFEITGFTGILDIR